MMPLAAASLLVRLAQLLPTTPIFAASTNGYGAATAIDAAPLRHIIATATIDISAT